MMKLNYNIDTILAGIIIITLIVGYILNIYKLLGNDFEAPIKSEIIRTIGIVVMPVGIFAGWKCIDDECKEKENNDD